MGSLKRGPRGGKVAQPLGTFVSLAPIPIIVHIKGDWGEWGRCGNSQNETGNHPLAELGWVIKGK